MSSVKKGVDFMRSVVKYMANDGSFGGACLKNIQVLDGGDGRLKAEFKVLPEHLNSAGGLHGGFTASLVDILTTVALMTTDTHPGVSVDLQVSYLRAAKEGDSVLVDATTVKTGRSLAFLECQLTHKDSGALIAKGSQTKFVDLVKTNYSKNISA
ncbi:acyl-coenzyme A thioesterase 13-like [Phlebotomus argentipes]|uniref:acyl-coenzyme A thioesterase 13-like n=1 Tax=Phlebotomus argentipes TaxID=94469 RepID=UPI002892F2C9|nr:acyl-coenzyme A thioesterase 13-like [Phlebotomus argentipes]